MSTGRWLDYPLVADDVTPYDPADPAMTSVTEAALAHWIRVALTRPEDADEVYRSTEQELFDMRRSVSWRITAPLRTVRRWIP